MKKLLTIIALAAASLTVGQAQIIITEVMSNSSHAGGSGNGDWFEIYNAGASTVDLSDWSWDDDSNTPGTHTFGSITIAAGGFVLVVDENATLINNFAADVWGITPSSNLVIVNNTMTTGFSGFGAPGDTIYIYNGSDIQQASATFGTATSGVTFEWNSTGTSLGLSVVGENGAYTALLDGNDGGADTNPALFGVGTDVGSPGVIPEPSTYALLALGLGALTVLRRRRA